MYWFQWCVSHLRISICSLLYDYWLVSIFFTRLVLFSFIPFAFHFSLSFFLLSICSSFTHYYFFFLPSFLPACSFYLFIFLVVYIHSCISTTHGYIMYIYQPKGVITIILYSHKHVRISGIGHGGWMRRKKREKERQMKSRTQSKI